MEKLTPQTAWEVLNGATSNLVLVRSQHLQILEALDILKRIVEVHEANLRKPVEK